MNSCMEREEMCNDLEKFIIFVASHYDANADDVREAIEDEYHDYLTLKPHIDKTKALEGAITNTALLLQLPRIQTKPADLFSLKRSQLYFRSITLK